MMFGAQQAYEKTMHAHWENWRNTYKVQLMKEVRRQMMLEGDYASYYHSPTSVKYARLLKEEYGDTGKRVGSF